MYSFMIIAILAALGFGMWSIIKGDSSILLIGLMLSTVSVALSAISISTSHCIGVEDYSAVKSYSYITENGDVVTLSDTIYEKDGVYYKQEMGLAAWIPFYPVDYVEVELPRSANDNENNLHRTCLNCGNVCNFGNKYCSECGTALATFCPNCGVECDSPFCGQCGAAMNQEG